MNKEQMEKRIKDLKNVIFITYMQEKLSDNDWELLSKWEKELKTLEDMQNEEL